MNGRRNMVSGPVEMERREPTKEVRTARRRSASRSLVALVALTCSWVVGSDASTVAAQSSDISRLFARRGRFECDGARWLVRASLPPDLLEGAAPDLHDLRLFDDGGEEVPWARVDADLVARRAEAAPTVHLAAVDASEVTSVRERVTIVTERYQLILPPPAFDDTVRELIVDVANGSPDFVRQVRVDVSGAGATTPSLGSTSAPLVEGSIYLFRGTASERLGIELPAGAPDHIEITIEGEGAALHPQFRLRAVRRSLSLGAVQRELPIESTTSANGRTTLSLRRPPGGTPDRVVFSTSTSMFARRARVFALDENGGRTMVGEADIVRVPTAAPRAEVESLARPDLAPAVIAGSRLEVRITRPIETRRFEIVIEDGDSPPLADLRVSASSPEILLLMPRRPSVALFGADGVRAPRYDISSLVGLGGDAPDEALVGVFAQSDIGSCWLHAAEANADFQGPPSYATLLARGQTVDASQFAHVATLTVPDSASGVVRFDVPLDIAAAASSDLSDLRIVDAEGRQLPYLLAGVAPTIELEVSVGERRREGRRSIYPLVLPHEPLELAELRLDPDAEMLSRLVEVYAVSELDTARHLVTSAMLERTANSEPAVITLDRAPRASSLELEVDDGDEAPLAFRSVRGRARSTTVELVAAAGTYRVLVGHPGLPAPSYDVARFALVLDQVEAVTPAIGTLAANPTYRAPSFLDQVDAPSIALWVLLAVVVAALLGLTLRVAGEPEPDAPAPSTPVDGGPAASRGATSSGAAAEGATSTTATSNEVSSEVDARSVAPAEDTATTGVATVETGDDASTAIDERAPGASDDGRDR